MLKLETVLLSTAALFWIVFVKLGMSLQFDKHLVRNPALESGHQNHQLPIISIHSGTCGLKK